MSSSSGALKESLGAVVEPSGVADVVTSDMTCDIVDWQPTETVLEQHRLAYAAYYHCTAELPRLKDLVRFSRSMGPPIERAHVQDRGPPDAGENPQGADQ